jgi:hypothetical protein
MNRPLYSGGWRIQPSADAPTAVLLLEELVSRKRRAPDPSAVF